MPAPPRGGNLRENPPIVGQPRQPRATGKRRFRQRVSDLPGPIVLEWAPSSAGYFAAVPANAPNRSRKHGDAGERADILESPLKQPLKSRQLRRFGGQLLDSRPAFTQTAAL